MALAMPDGKHVTIIPLHELLTTNAPKTVFEFDELVYSFMVMHATASPLTAASCLLASHSSCGNASWMFDDPARMSVDAVDHLTHLLHDEHCSMPQRSRTAPACA